MARHGEDNWSARARWQRLVDADSSVMELYASVAGDPGSLFVAIWNDPGRSRAGCRRRGFWVFFPPRPTVTAKTPLREVSWTAPAMRKRRGKCCHGAG